MISTIPKTFIDIFSENPADPNDIFIKQVVIPIIQRDYAQGRENEDVSRIRSRFLDALKDALVEENNPITLDFVYGEINQKGSLIPLDGQQRLTTLFLLHWYISKHEEVDSSKCEFLKSFSYRTRYGARKFCELLSSYTPDFKRDKLSEDILDQSWFPMDWTNDPTIASMLVMIDAIHLKFQDTSDLWHRLEEGAISFYFLPIKDMGLTDQLYIKMNSRGKPLTLFEHFKAELERSMKSVDQEIADRISGKIDKEWTYMLWPYRGDNNIIDDEFLRYFHFLCDILNYKNEEKLIEDPFIMVQSMFSCSNNDAKENLLYIEKLFDCWCEIDIDSFFEKYLTTGTHSPQKSIVGKATNLFLDCCNVYGEMQDSRVRKFSIGRSILLYAFILFLLNKETINEDDFIRRLRVVNNLERASEYELRDDRMKTLLSQTEEIILYGNIELVDKSFNPNQLIEEVEKQQRIALYPEEELLFREAEDHPLLNGAVRVLGIESIALYPRFEQLFKCNWDTVDRALLATGDYSKFIRWRYQIGSSRVISVWQSLFNSSEQDMIPVKTVLRSLLQSNEKINDDVLGDIITEYLKTGPAYDWRYYLINYQSMRPGRYGMYRWEGEGNVGKESRVILMMMTEKSTGGKNYNIFLKTLYDRLKPEFPNMVLGDYAFQHVGDKLYLGGDLAVSSNESSFTFYRILDNASEEIDSIPIPQVDGQLLDAVDRVLFGEQLIREKLNIGLI